MSIKGILVNSSNVVEQVMVLADDWNNPSSENHYTTPPGKLLITGRDASVGWTYEGGSFIPPIYVHQVALEQKDVEIMREIIIARGITVTVGGNNILVQTRNPTDFRNINALSTTALAKIAIGDGSTVEFRDGNNVNWTLSPEQIISLNQQVTERVSYLYQRYWAIKSLNPIPPNFRDDVFWV